MNEPDAPADGPPANATPPTVPGAIVSQVAPMNRTAVWSLICGVTGLVLPVVDLAGIILGIVALNRIRRAEPPERGLGVAIAGICVGAFGMLMSVFVVISVLGMVQAFSQMGTMIANVEMSQIHMQAGRHAASSGGYPVHVAEMLASTRSGLSPSSFIADKTVQIGPGMLTLGTYDFSKFDGSATARQDVVAAVRAFGGGPVYAFGDYWFVRIPKPSNDPAIVFAWRVDPDGRIIVLRDDGTMNNNLQRDEWSELWRADAAAREGNGFPAVDMPPTPALPGG